MADVETRVRTWRIALPHLDDDGKPLTFSRTAKGNLKLTITSNSRHHWRQRSSVTRRLRETAARLITAHGIPPQRFVRVWVELHHPEPGKKYLMDAGNLAAMSKPLVDALQEPRAGKLFPRTGRVVGRAAGAGIVPNDGEDFVLQERDRIERGSVEYREPRIVLVVEGQEFER